MKLPDTFKRLRTSRQTASDTGEDQALAYLLQHAYVLVERNYHCRGGEIDLIMQKDGMLVFVEVRKRANGQFGAAAASVVPAKQARLKRAAQFYLQRYAAPPACRFDVSAIDGDQLNWIINAIKD